MRKRGRSDGGTEGGRNGKRDSDEGRLKNQRIGNEGRRNMK